MNPLAEMTDAEIDGLDAGPEADALVAEHVMGWECYDTPTHIEGTRSWPFAWLDRQGGTLRIARATDSSYFEAWCPSSEESAAWLEVVKALDARGAGWRPIIVRTFTLMGERGPWRACFGDPDAHADAETVPMAVCRAALKAVRTVLRRQTRAGGE